CPTPSYCRLLKRFTGGVAFTGLSVCKNVAALRCRSTLPRSRVVAGNAGAQGPKGDTGATGPSASFVSQQTSDFTVPEPGGGLGTPIVSVTLSPGTYLVHVTGSVTRAGLASGQGATHSFQIRRDGTF